MAAPCFCGLAPLLVRVGVVASSFFEPQVAGELVHFGRV